jgi:type II secretory pathway pseudopilin PulG
MMLRRKSLIAAYTLVELMVGAVIFMAISAAAYQVYRKSTQRAITSQEQAKLSRGLKQFMERFRGQVENAVQLPNAETTMLRVSRPNTDSTQRDCVNSNEPQSDMGWGLIPFPGRNVSDITNTLTPFDPSVTFDETAKPNDGVRVVYVPEDSTINYLAYQSGTTPFPTSAGQDIIIEGSPVNLAVGDFAVVADVSRKDLIRITNITPSGGTTAIEHDHSKSIWNMNPANPGYPGYNYGATYSSLGKPVLYKVKVATYALDETKKLLMMDAHTNDDGFAPPNTWGTAGLALNWEVVAPNVSKFQVIYVPMTVSDDGVLETRKPQAGLVGRDYDYCSAGSVNPNCDCHNQLGNPNLKTVKVTVEFEKPDPNSNKAIMLTETSVEEFNPTILKKSLPGVRSSAREGCNYTDLLYSTNEDGTPNTACNTSTGCFCTDRSLPSLCAPPPYGVGTGCPEPSGGGDGTDPGYGDGAG